MTREQTYCTACVINNCVFCTKTYIVPKHTNRYMEWKRVQNKPAWIITTNYTIMTSLTMSNNGEKATSQLNNTGGIIYPFVKKSES